MCSDLPILARYSVTRLPGSNNSLSRIKRRREGSIRYGHNVYSVFIAIKREFILMVSYLDDQITNKSVIGNVIFSVKHLVYTRTLSEV